jgi:hypothetical protein
MNFLTVGSSEAISPALSLYTVEALVYLHEESVKVQKKLAHFKAIIQHLSGWTEENTGKFQSG